MATNNSSSSLEREVQKELRRVEADLGAAQDKVGELEERRERVRSVLDTLRPGSSVATRRPKARAPKAKATAKRSAGSRAAAPKAKAKPRAKARGTRKLVSTTERTDQLRDLLSKNELTRGQIAEKLGVTPVRVQQLMKPLISAGELSERPDPSSSRPRSLWRAKKGSAKKAKQAA